MNRFVWDMRYPSASRVPGDMSTEGDVTGPLAPPGAYQVRIEVGEQSETQSFDIVQDPRVKTSREDVEAQFALLVKIRDRLSEAHDAVNRIRAVRTQVDEWGKRVEGHSSADVVSKSGQDLKEKLSSIENELIQRDYKGLRDINDLPTKLNLNLAELMDVVASADFAPPKQAYDVFADFSGRLDSQLRGLREVVGKDLSEFENLLYELEIPAIVS